MLSGLLLILLGILITLHPKIIVVLVAGFLIASGFTMMLVSWRLRRAFRAGQQSTNAWSRFIVRF